MMNGLQQSLKFGFYGGIIAVYVSIIGMLSVFSERDIIDKVISMGYTMLIIIVFLTSYLAARRIDSNAPDTKTKSTTSRYVFVLYGLVAGLTIGLMLAALVIIANQVNLQPVLFNVTEELLDILTLGRGNTTGALLLASSVAALGALSGFLFALPQNIRRPLLTSLSALAITGMMSELIRITLSEFSTNLAQTLVTTNGLTKLGGSLIFVAVFAYTLASQIWGKAIRQRKEQLPPAQQTTLRIATWFLALAGLAGLPWLLGRVGSDMLVLVGIYVMMGFGLNIVVGKAGLLDLGYVAFFAVGAYSMAILTSPLGSIGTELSFWQALPIVIIVTGIAGLLVGAPVLRMRGDYLAIVTLGFGEIARFIALSDWFEPWLGGAQGILKIPTVTLGSFEFLGPQRLYYLVLIGSIIALFISLRIEESRVGRAWVAMREDEQVAEAMGVNTTYYKLLAFGMGAMIASVGGAIFAVKLSAIFPHSFNVNVSITVLSLLIIGGIGSLPGVIVGAFALVGLPELLREFSEYRLLFYGAALMIMMIVRPEGLLPSRRRTRELHEEEKQQDDWVQAQSASE